MDKFWERYIQSRPAPGESKGAFDAFAAAHRDPGPRTMKLAGGGMVGIRKPNAIAPTGGPMDQGLPSLYNNVRKRQEYKWQKQINHSRMFDTR